MNLPAEIRRCQALLVGLSRRLREMLAGARRGGLDHVGGFGAMVHEWVSLPQAEIRVIPTDNIEGAAALLELCRLTTVIASVSVTLEKLVDEHGGDVPIGVVEAFKAELDRVRL